MVERFSSLVTKSRPWPVIGRTIFFTSDKNRPTRDEIYFIDFWRENLSMYRITGFIAPVVWLQNYFNGKSTNRIRNVIRYNLRTLFLNLICRNVGIFSLGRKNKNVT